MEQAPASSTPPDIARYQKIPLSGRPKIIYYTKAESESNFSLFKSSFSGLQTGQAVKVTEYCREESTGGLIRDTNSDSYSMVDTGGCQFIDKNSGVYKTPQKGLYTFTGGLGQVADGKLEMYACEDRNGTRKLLGKTETGDPYCGGAVEFELDKGVGVWVEVDRLEGETSAMYLRFSGRLVVNREGDSEDYPCLVFNS